MVGRISRVYTSCAVHVGPYIWAQLAKGGGWKSRETNRVCNDSGSQITRFDVKQCTVDVVRNEAQL